MNKKRKLLSPVFSIVLALVIGFAATYSLYYFSVDCYKYSGNKNTLSFEDLGFILSDNSSALSTFIKKGNNFSIEEEQEALKCLEDAKYTELPLEKAFPMYWAVFRNKYFCFEFYDEAADISGEVYLFGKSVYICVTDYNLNGDFPLQTVFKAQNINADKIKELHLLGYPYSDFAILYRANALSRQFEDMLLRYQIPYVIYGGLSFFERKEVKDMIAYLRLIINHDDDFAFKRIVNEPKRKIGDALLDKLKTAQINNNCSLFEAIDHIETSGIGFNNLIAFKFTILELFDEYIANEDKPLIKIIDGILDKTGYGSMLKNEGEEGQDRLENVLELKTVIEEAIEYYELSRKNTLESLLSDLALRTDTDNKNESADCIKLMTYHQAKGLEYRVVFMVAMEQGIFPSFNCVSEQEQEEERRICYVGITRAKEKLYITNAETRYLYGQQQNEAPSIYIKEMGLDNLNVIGKIKRPITTPITQTTTSAPTKVEKEPSAQINKGDKINHKAFGDGLVVEKNGNVITVAFMAPYGVKKLSAVHPSIRKI